MEERVSYIFLNIEGASNKVLQFLMPIELIYKKNFYFSKQNAYNEHLGLNN